MKALALLVITGCSLYYEPDVGRAIDQDQDTSPPVDGADPEVDGGGSNPVTGCDNSDSDPSVAVSFVANIRPLMTRSPGGCSPCHLGRITSGLDLSSYQALRRGGLNSGAKVVVPGDPCDSILPQKLGRTPPFGSRMPFNGPPYFTADERQLVRDWIAEGALNN